MSDLQRKDFYCHIVLADKAGYLLDWSLRAATHVCKCKDFSGSEGSSCAK